MRTLLVVLAAAAPLFAVSARSAGALATVACLNLGGGFGDPDHVLVILTPSGQSTTTPVLGGPCPSEFPPGL